MRSAIRSVLISIYRNPDSLPLADGFDEVKAERYAMLVYSIASLLFAGIFIAYFQIDALKEDVITITTKPIAGQTCQSLSAVNKQVPFYSFTTAMACPEDFIDSSPPLCTPGFSIKKSTQVAPVIQYDSAFYETYGDCLQAVSTSCTLSMIVTGNYYSSYRADRYTGTYKDVYVSCSFAPGITLAGLQSGNVSLLKLCNADNGDAMYACMPDRPKQGCYSYHYANGTWSIPDFNYGVNCFKYDNDFYDYVSTFTPMTAATLTSVVNDLMPPSSVCAPYLQNPPYQCTRRAALSAFNVLSQSLAITTTCIALLISVTTLVGSYLHGANVSPDPDASDATVSSVGIDAFSSSSPESKSH